MSLYRQIILLTLTLLVLVSSTGMAVGMHLCGGELRDITFFGAEAECPMEQQQNNKKPACHKSPEDSESDNTCCQDNKVVVDRVDVLSHASDITIHKLQDVKFLAIIKSFVINFFSINKQQNPAYAFYESPPLARNIPLLVQSFLL
jgi:hypothetical protein